MKTIYRITRYIILNVAAILGKYNFKTYIKNSKDAQKRNKKLILNIIKKNKNTEYGKKYDFKNIKTIEDYQIKIPFTTYSDYKQYINETANTGKQNLMTSFKIRYFANTSGTTGEVKRIPVTAESYNSFFKAGTIFTFQLKEEMKKNHLGRMNGKILNLSEMVSKKTPGGIREGLISGYFASGLKTFLPIATCIPKEVLGNEDRINMKYIKARYALQESDIICINAVFMSAITDLMKYICENREMLIKDIETGTIDSSIVIPEDIRKKLERKLIPNKNRADEIREILKNDGEKELASNLWKRLSLIIAICTGEFSPYENKIREYINKNVAISYSMYASSEATIASSLYKENKDYMLLFDGGFYEFIPIEDESKTLLMNELEIGKEYEIVITNLSGLYRYKIKDVIKVVGFEGDVPLIHFAYRKEQLINISALHLTMEHLEKIIKKLEKELDFKIVDYSVYQDTENVPSRILLFIETKDDKEMSNDTIQNAFDNNISKAVPIFKSLIEHNNIDKSVVYIVKSGTYEKYRELKAKKASSVNQVKTVRLIKDEKTLKYFLDNCIIKKEK